MCHEQGVLHAQEMIRINRRKWSDTSPIKTVEIRLYISCPMLVDGNVSNKTVSCLLLVNSWQGQKTHAFSLLINGRMARPLGLLFQLQKTECHGPNQFSFVKMLQKQFIIWIMDLNGVCFSVGRFSSTSVWPLSRQHLVTPSSLSLPPNNLRSRWHVSLRTCVLADTWPPVLELAPSVNIRTTPVCR